MGFFLRKWSGPNQLISFGSSPGSAGGLNKIKEEEYEQMQIK
jgi:hypothetical protein